MVLILSGFVALWVNGVGVSLGPSSLGLLLLGAGLFLKAFDSRSECQSVGVGLIGVVLVAAVYLVWRAWTGGPEGLAFSDIWLVLILVASYLASSSGGENFAKGAFFGLLVLSVVGVYLSFTQVFSADPKIHEVTGEVTPIKATGFFGFHNRFASFAVTSFFLIFFGGILWNKNLIVRAIVCIVLGGLFWAIVASGSRGGWLALVAGGSVCIWGLWAYLRRHQSDRAPIVALAGVVIALLALVSSWWVVKKQTAARANLDQVAQVDGELRLDFQKMALDLGFESPVIGNGARSFSYRVFEQWDLDRLPIWVPNPEFAHNEFLQLFCDYGIVGVILASLAIAVHFIYGIVAIQTEDVRNSGCGGTLRPAALGGMVAILAQCYFSFLLHSPAIVAMFGLLAGLAGRRGVAPSKLGAQQRALCCLGGLLAMFVGGDGFFGISQGA
ncbi:O-antigen ligase family protein [Akkermansiaceae bacterium]|nr:O-antigen ligase family protein [Akkermansiaceae bacterium]